MTRLKEDYRIAMILKELDEHGPLCMNQIIDNIWDRDNATGELWSRGWRFYVHLNKLPAKMKRAGLIIDLGKIKSGKHEGEKLWTVSLEVETFWRESV
jgi:hypothetical protein